MAGTLPGFDAGTFRDAIHLVQEFFTPTDSRATFYFPDTPATGSAVDSENVPFDPSTTVVRTPSKPPVVVPCSVEYQEVAGRLEDFGVVVPSRIVVTLLDADYVAVKGFWYVVINGTRYFYRSTDIPAALGSVEVWSIRCQAEDET